MIRTSGLPFAVIGGNEQDRGKKRFTYLKTPIKGLFYIPSETERKSRTLNGSRFVGGLLEALKKYKKMKLHYGVVTSGWNAGLTWRPTKLVEVFNGQKTFEMDFDRFAEKYRNGSSYYSKTIAKFYDSIALKRIIFRKVKLVPPEELAYDEKYLPGFYIRKEGIPKRVRRYMPKNTARFLVLKKEYQSLLADMKRLNQ